MISQMLIDESRLNIKYDLLCLSIFNKLDSLDQLNTQSYTFMNCFTFMKKEN
jgi:hypothetical protein